VTTDDTCTNLQTIASAKTPHHATVLHPPYPPSVMNALNILDMDCDADAVQH